MTVIAYRDGIIAADMNCWSGDSGVVMRRRKKVQRVGSALIAAAGNSDDIQRVLKWFIEGGEKPKVDDTIEVLFVNDAGALIYYQSLEPLQIHEQLFALGCQKPFMMGALRAGATAEQAVRLAMEWTDAGAGPVQVERLELAQ